ncbi:unnamed protein product, partial [marine sediment metagenome]
MNASEIWAALDSVGFRIMRLVLSVLWQSSILLVAATALHCLLRRRRASARCVVWTIAILAAPLLPFLNWAASGLGTPQAPIPAIPAYSAPREAAEPPARHVEDDMGTPETAAPMEFTAEPVAPLPVEEAEAVSLANCPWAIALLGYATGAAVFLSIVALGRVRIGRWVRKGIKVADVRVLDAFEEARGSLGLSRGFSLVESGAVRTPVTVRAFRPVVLLPKDFAQELTDAELRTVAIHELSHVKRHDPLMLSAVSLVRAVFFFHPLIWLACRQLSRLSEMACDDAVLDATGEPVSYAK